MCSQSGVEWYEIAPLVAMVTYIREITAKQSCEYSEHQVFEPSLFLLFKLSVGQMYATKQCLLLFFISVDRKSKLFLTK